MPQILINRPLDRPPGKYRLPDPSVYVGIDPGVSGGVAAVVGGRVYFRHLATTDREVWDWFCMVKALRPDNAVTDRPYPIFACIEKVGGYIPRRGVGQPGSAMFKFGASFGMLRGFLVASGIPFEEVPPQTWQKAMGVSPRAKKAGSNVSIESDSQFKNRIKQKAQQLFPSVNVTLATSDALVIAEYTRRKREGKL